MPRRSTSLNQYTSTAITREIDSKYDYVKTVADNIEGVEAIAAAIVDGTFNSADIVIAEPLKNNINTVAGISAEILAVVNNEADIDTVADNITDITGVANNLTSILEAATMLNNLTVSSSTIAYTDEATAAVTGNNIAFGIPQGVPGVAGEDGRSPQYEFVVDGDDLVINLTEYTESSEPSIGEWN